VRHPKLPEYHYLLCQFIHACSSTISLSKSLQNINRSTLFAHPSQLPSSRVVILWVADENPKSTETGSSPDQVARRDDIWGRASRPTHPAYAQDPEFARFKFRINGHDPVTGEFKNVETHRQCVKEARVLKKVNPCPLVHLIKPEHTCA
jgi:hypothetical protein